jgi:hypothetical protein
MFIQNLTHKTDCCVERDHYKKLNMVVLQHVFGTDGGITSTLQ